MYVWFAAQPEPFKILVLLEVLNQRTIVMRPTEAGIQSTAGGHVARHPNATTVSSDAKSLICASFF